MEKNPRKTTNLVEQNDALTGYLEALLAEASFAEDEARPLAADLQQEKDIPTVLADAPLQTETPLVIESRAAVLALTNAPPPVEQPGQPVHVSDSEHANASPEPPGWVQDRLQYLSFHIAGMMFAAPLEQLNGILPWDGAVTALPGGPSWFLGLLRNRDRNVKVIEIGSLLRQSTAQSAVMQRYLLLMDNGAWGMVCDRVSDVLRLDAADVKWSVPHKKLPFVIGTAPEKMCAIFDVAHFLELLNAGGI